MYGGVCHQKVGWRIGILSHSQGDGDLDLCERFNILFKLYYDNL